MLETRPSFQGQDGLGMGEGLGNGGRTGRKYEALPGKIQSWKKALTEGATKPRSL